MPIAEFLGNEHVKHVVCAIMAVGGTAIATLSFLVLIHAENWAVRRSGAAAVLISGFRAGLLFALAILGAFMAIVGYSLDM